MEQGAQTNGRVDGSGAAGPADHYAVLGLRSDASADEVRSAFRRLARLHHPDSQDAEQGQASTDAMARLNEAYAVLSDTHRRTEHDLALRLARRAQGSPPPPAPARAATRVRTPRWLVATSALLVGGALAGWTLWRPVAPPAGPLAPAVAADGAAGTAAPEDQPLRLVATRELARLPGAGGASAAQAPKAATTAQAAPTVASSR